MFHATYEIANAFDDEDISYHTEHNENNSRVIAGISGDYCRYSIQFISSDDDNDVSIRVFDLAKFPAEMLVPVLRTVNDINCKYKYVKFCVDREDRSISAQYDMPVRTDDPGKSAKMLFHVFIQIIDDVFPVLMRVIWGNAYTGNDDDLNITFHES